MKNAATTQEQPQPFVTFEVAESRFGTPTPTIRIAYPRGTHFRKAHALALRLAAEVELATPVLERWCVTVEHDGDLCCRVTVDTIDGSEAEARRAMSVLRGVVADRARVLP